MKPLNIDSSPCTPTSSNCVIWQGPDIACINLCKGDTISSVVYKLATELCSVIETLNISTYDLSCLNLTNVTPQSFKDLVDLIILKICELETTSDNVVITPGSGGASPTDTIVTVASCFITGTQTTMNLQDYVIAIGTRVCSLITDIGLNTAAINALDIRVTDLENATPPSYTTPQITLDQALATLSAGVLYDIDNVLNVYINDVWFPFVDVTGDTSALGSVIIFGSATVAGSDDSKANPGTIMQVQYAGDWVSGAVTIADSIKNLWVNIKDLRLALPTLAVDNTGNVTFTLTTGAPNYQIKGDVALPTVTMTNGDTIAFTETVGAPDYEFTAEVIPFNGLSVKSSGVAITNVSKVVPSLTTIIDSASSTTLILNTVEYDDGSDYSPVTGEWTCPANGRYNLSFNVKLSHTTDAAGWHTGGGSHGAIIAGLVSSTNVAYVSNSFSPSASISPVADISGNVEGVVLTAGTVLRLKVLNLTDFDYVSEASDVATMSIQRIK